MEFDPLLSKIIESDMNIRHCIVADLKGNILSVKHKDGVENYLSEEETAKSLVRAASAWKARKQLELLHLKSSQESPFPWVKTICFLSAWHRTPLEQTFIKAVSKTL